MMPPWLERPIEEAGLFNPAFCSLLIARTVADYRKRMGEGLPFPLAFLVLPVVLHPATREALPESTQAVLHNWTTGNATLISDFPDRAHRMTIVTKEALLFGLLHKKLAMEGARILPGPNNYPTNVGLEDLTPDADSCLRKAAFLGRWFTRGGTPATILSSWGLKP